MKIITWNCQGAFRKKAALIAQYRPDLAIIQECEAPEKCLFAADVLWPTAQAWFGDQPAKGVGVFSYTDLQFGVDPAYDPTIRYCIPIRVGGGQYFNLLAVWAMNHPNRHLSYVGQLCLALEAYGALIARPDTLLIGDFNSNTQWDNQFRGCNHSQVIEILAQANIVSIYHDFYQEEQGQESRDTFYLYRNRQKGYHLDYCFVPADWASRVQDVWVGSYDEWARFSDHAPLFMEVDWPG